MANKVITVTDPSIVTNDTLAGYNNYSDIDGQLGTTMTPTEATNGHTVALSDGVVHEVTTKPVGTTNGEFSAVVSNAVTVDLSASGYIFYEDFSGPLNTTTRWTLRNDNASTIFGVPDGEMEVIAGTITASYTVNYYLSQISAPLSSTEDVYGCVDIRCASTEYSGLSFGLIDDMVSKSGTRITNTTDTDGYRFYSYVGNNLENDSSTLSGLDLNTIKTIKMAVTNNGANFDAWQWNGSTWVSLYTATGLTTFNANLKIHIGASGNSNYTDPFYVDNAYLTDTDFATQYPV